MVLCIQPGSGDNIQFMKSGIFEIPNIILVTKSDLKDLSNLTYSDLKGSENLFEYDDDGIEILKISSHKSFGFKGLFDVISKRWRILGKKKFLIRGGLKILVGLNGVLSTNLVKKVKSRLKI